MLERLFGTMNKKDNTLFVVHRLTFIVTHLLPLPSFQFGNDFGHQVSCLFFRHDPALGHNADTFVDHSLHRYSGLRELPIFKTEMAVIIDSEPASISAEILRLLQGHAAALAKRPLGLLCCHSITSFLL